MDYELAQEIKLRLKAPKIVAERVAQKQYVSNVFGKAALSELNKIQKIIENLEKKKGSLV